MKLKKLLSLLLCLALAFCLAACGNNDQPDTPDTPDTPVTPPKSDYQQAYDAALTAFYLPEGIWQLQLLDENGNTASEATAYLRFNHAETEILCSTTLVHNSLTQFGGTVSHTTTATSTATTTMRIDGTDGAYVELRLGSIDVGSNARYNVTYVANMLGAEVSAPALLQPLAADDPLLVLAEFQLANYQLPLDGIGLDNYLTEQRGEVWAILAASAPVIDGIAPQVVFKGYKQAQYGIMHNEEYALIPRDAGEVLTWFGYDENGRLTQDAQRAVCCIYYLTDDAATITTDYAERYSPLYAVTDGSSFNFYGGSSNQDDAAYELWSFARTIAEDEISRDTDYLTQLQAAAKKEVDENHYYVLMQPYIGGVPDYTRMGVAEVENGSVKSIYDPLTGLFFYER